ncbi:PLDc N-terminal domain-containing protein [Nocardiopsis sp. JB363]|uniref:PLDc N-terminal domain-containing protein n=1 Tax=Nocardiopsis sp. JB363 TaxID=1434837 RepID=UPI00097AB442|nr:PLDc N-terminal domain-containing protein [Nocardiopsis sp. JB363]SIO88833.1 hypothetical protein BQ8420_20100 [Nocardiopsis sp. JB363]
MIPENLLANSSPELLFGLGFAGVYLTIALAVVVLVVAAVFSVLFSRIGFGMKVVWLIFVIIAPVIGALLWFFIGRNHTPVRYW